VPQWVKFGVFKLNADDVMVQKMVLKAVGHMTEIWKKIYDLLWPSPAEKRWGLTHTKLINVLQEMINAVPVDKDGAPDKLLMTTARERYHNLLTNLTSKQAVMVSETEYLPASLPPSSSHISASSGFAGFENYTPDRMRQSL